jgi:hypothetical protein
MREALLRFGDQVTQITSPLAASSADAASEASPRRLALIKLATLLPRGSFPIGNGPPALNSACSGSQGNASGRMHT